MENANNFTPKAYDKYIAKKGDIINIDKIIQRLQIYNLMFKSQ